MAQQQGSSVPGPFGGLVRYDSEYGGKFKLTPTQVMIFVVIIVIAVSALKIFWKIG